MIDWKHHAIVAGLVLCWEAWLGRKKFLNAASTIEILIVVFVCVIRFFYKREKEKCNKFN